MTAKEINKLLKGKKIIKVKLNPFPDGRRCGEMAHFPEIYIEGGIILRFRTEETDLDVYGTTLIVSTSKERIR